MAYVQPNSTRSGGAAKGEQRNSNSSNSSSNNVVASRRGSAAMTTAAITLTPRVPHPPLAQPSQQQQQRMSTAVVAAATRTTTTARAQTSRRPSLTSCSAVPLLLSTHSSRHNTPTSTPLQLSQQQQLLQQQQAQAQQQASGHAYVVGRAIVNPYVAVSPAVQRRVREVAAACTTRTPPSRTLSLSTRSLSGTQAMSATAASATQAADVTTSTPPQQRRSDGDCVVRRPRVGVTLHCIDDASDDVSGDEYDKDEATATDNNNNDGSRHSPQRRCSVSYSTTLLTTTTSSTSTSATTTTTQVCEDNATTAAADKSHVMHGSGGSSSITMLPSLSALTDGGRGNNNSCNMMANSVTEGGNSSHATLRSSSHLRNGSVARDDVHGTWLPLRTTMTTTTQTHRGSNTGATTTTTTAAATATAATAMAGHREELSMSIMPLLGSMQGGMARFARASHEDRSHAARNSHSRLRRGDDNAVNVSNTRHTRQQQQQQRGRDSPRAYTSRNAVPALGIVDVHMRHSPRRRHSNNNNNKGDSDDTRRRTTTTAAMTTGTCRGMTLLRRLYGTNDEDVLPWPDAHVAPHDEAAPATAPQQQQQPQTRQRVCDVLPEFAAAAAAAVAQPLSSAVAPSSRVDAAVLRARRSIDWSVAVPSPDATCTSAATIAFLDNNEDEDDGDGNIIDNNNNNNNTYNNNSAMASAMTTSTRYFVLDVRTGVLRVASAPSSSSTSNNNNSKSGDVSARDGDGSTRRGSRTAVSVSPPTSPSLLQLCTTMPAAMRTRTLTTTSTATISNNNNSNHDDTTMTAAAEAARLQRLQRRIVVDGPHTYRIRGCVGVLPDVATRAGVVRLVEYAVRVSAPEMFVAPPYVDASCGDVVLPLNTSLLGTVRVTLAAYDCVSVDGDTHTLTRSSNTLTCVIAVERSEGAHGASSDNKSSIHAAVDCARTLRGDAGVYGGAGDELLRTQRAKMLRTRLPSRASAAATSCAHRLLPGSSNNNNSNSSRRDMTSAVNTDGNATTTAAAEDAVLPSCFALTSPHELYDEVCVHEAMACAAATTTTTTRSQQTHNKSSRSRSSNDDGDNGDAHARTPSLSSSTSSTLSLWRVFGASPVMFVSLRLLLWQRRLCALIDDGDDGDVYSAAVRTQFVAQTMSTRSGSNSVYALLSRHHRNNNSSSSNESVWQATSTTTLRCLRRLVLCLLLARDKAAPQLTHDVLRVCAQLRHGALLRCTATTGGTTRGLANAAELRRAAAAASSQQQQQQQQQRLLPLQTSSARCATAAGPSAAAAAAATTAAQRRQRDRQHSVCSLVSNKSSEGGRSHSSDNNNNNNKSRSSVHGTYASMHAHTSLSAHEQRSLRLLDDALHVSMTALLLVGAFADAVVYATQRVHVAYLLAQDDDDEEEENNDEDNDDNNNNNTEDDDDVVTMALLDLADALYLFGDYRAAAQTARDAAASARQRADRQQQTTTGATTTAARRSNAARVSVVHAELLLCMSLIAHSGTTSSLARDMLQQLRRYATTTTHAQCTLPLEVQVQLRLVCASACVPSLGGATHDDVMALLDEAVALCDVNNNNNNNSNNASSSSGGTRVTWMHDALRLFLLSCCGSVLCELGAMQRGMHILEMAVAQLVLTCGRALLHSSTTTTAATAMTASDAEVYIAAQKDEQQRQRSLLACVLWTTLAAWQTTMPSTATSTPSPSPSSMRESSGSSSGGSGGGDVSVSLLRRMTHQRTRACGCFHPIVAIYHLHTVYTAVVVRQQQQQQQQQQYVHSRSARAAECAHALHVANKCMRVLTYNVYGGNSSNRTHHHHHHVAPSSRLLLYGQLLYAQLQCACGQWRRALAPLLRAVATVTMQHNTRRRRTRRHSTTAAAVSVAAGDGAVAAADAHNNNSSSNVYATTLATHMLLGCLLRCPRQHAHDDDNSSTDRVDAADGSVVVRVRESTLLAHVQASLRSASMLHQQQQQRQPSSCSSSSTTLSLLLLAHVNCAEVCYLLSRYSDAHASLQSALTLVEADASAASASTAAAATPRQTKSENSDVRAARSVHALHLAQLLFASAAVYEASGVISDAQRCYESALMCLQQQQQCRGSAHAPARATACVHVALAKLHYSNGAYGVALLHAHKAHAAMTAAAHTHEVSSGCDVCAMDVLVDAIAYRLAAQEHTRVVLVNTHRLRAAVSQSHGHATHVSEDKKKDDGDDDDDVELL